MKILLIDNYDSFTYNLYDYFLQLGTTVNVIRNDEKSLKEIVDLDFEAIVFSPGPKKPKDAGIMLSILEHYYKSTPILGICLGHQAIGEFFGATLTKAKLPVHGKTSQLYHTQHPVFKNLPQYFEVMRYHSLIIQDFEKTPLEIIAKTKEEEVMAIAHKNLPIHGFQFHPESILTEHGLAMLENWVNLVTTVSASS